MDTTASTTYYPGTTVNGWTCSQCGQWVSSNTSHSCWAYQTAPTPLPITIMPSQPVRLSDEDVDRIARRVVEMLKEAE